MNTRLCALLRVGSLALGVAQIGLAQTGETRPEKAEATTRPTPAELAGARAALATWIEAEDRDNVALATVKSIAAARKEGLTLVAKALAVAVDGERHAEVDAIEALIGRVGAQFITQVEKSEMVYPGQYDDLAVLMPTIGVFFVRTVVRPPQWFKFSDRSRAITALRDLYPKGPPRALRDQLELIAVSEDEPQDVRLGLAYALAQWGDRKLVRKEIADLQKKAASEDEEAKVLALRDLAQLFYAIRDYPVAAITYRDFLRAAEAAEAYLVPVYYYNAACCMCLSGDRRGALDYLRRSLVLNKSPQVDTSMRLKRKLFENDPEIALARSDKSFAKMLDDAFGPKPKPKPESKKK